MTFLTAYTLRFARMFGAVALLLLPPPVSSAQVRESDVKAAFLFNFAQFVTWPPEAFASTNAPLVIGIYGSDPFGITIDRLVENERIAAHPLEVRRVQTSGDILECHILYIPSSEERSLPRLLQTVQRRPILTVSDIDRFPLRGGMIGFYLSEGKVRLRVNPAEAKEAGLELSSKLLRVAQLVE